MTDDEYAPMYFCSSCGTQMPAPTGRCDPCAGRLGRGKRRRPRWAERRLARSSRCTICGGLFSAESERLLVKLPDDVHPEWTPRGSLVHQECASPLGLWPVGVRAWDETTGGAA